MCSNGKKLVVQTVLPWVNVCAPFMFFIITSAVKISTLTNAINFSGLMALKIFNAVNTGAELELAPPFINLSLLNNNLSYFYYLYLFLLLL